MCEGAGEESGPQARRPFSSSLPAPLSPPGTASNTFPGRQAVQTVLSLQ